MNNSNNYNEMSKDKRDKGWVYVITNKSIPNLVKIGFTTKDPKKRARQLAKEGLPHPYTVEYAIFVEKPYSVEQKIHRILWDKREGKEWFRISPEKAVVAIKSMIGSNYIEEKYYKVKKRIIEKEEKYRIAERTLEKVFEIRKKMLDDIFNTEKSRIDEKYTSIMKKFLEENTMNFWSIFVMVCLIFFMITEVVFASPYKGISGSKFVFLIIISVFTSSYIRGVLENKVKNKKEYKDIIDKKIYEIKELERKFEDDIKILEESKKRAMDMLKEGTLFFVCPFCEAENEYKIDDLDIYGVGCRYCGKEVLKYFDIL